MFREEREGEAREIADMVFGESLSECGNRRRE
jgi:hypothetical protein